MRLREIDQRVSPRIVGGCGGSRNACKLHLVFSRELVKFRAEDRSVVAIAEVRRIRRRTDLQIVLRGVLGESRGVWRWVVVAASAVAPTAACGEERDRPKSNSDGKNLGIRTIAHENLEPDSSTWAESGCPMVAMCWTRLP